MPVYTPSIIYSHELIPGGARMSKIVDSSSVHRLLFAMEFPTVFFENLVIQPEAWYAISRGNTRAKQKLKVVIIGMTWCNITLVSRNVLRISTLAIYLSVVVMCGATVGVKPGFHYPSWWPELTARVDGWPVSITRQLGPLTRTVNSGSGNRAERVKCSPLLEPAGYRGTTQYKEIGLKHFNGNSISCIVWN